MENAIFSNGSQAISQSNQRGLLRGNSRNRDSFAKSPTNSGNRVTSAQPRPRNFVCITHTHRKKVLPQLDRNSGSLDWMPFV